MMEFGYRVTLVNGRVKEVWLPYDSDDCTSEFIRHRLLEVLKKRRREGDPDIAIKHFEPHCAIGRARRANTRTS
jgi:hypothetical protein